MDEYERNTLEVQRLELDQRRDALAGYQDDRDREEREGFVERLLDSERVIQTLVKHFEGKRMIQELQNHNGIMVKVPKWVPYREGPLMNKQGISDITGILESRLTPNMNFNDLTKEDVNRIMLEINHELIEEIKVKHGEWGLNKYDATGVVNAVDHNAYTWLCQGREGALMRFTGTSRQERILRSETDRKLADDKKKFKLFGLWPKSAE